MADCTIVRTVVTKERMLNFRDHRGKIGMGYARITGTDEDTITAAIYSYGNGPVVLTPLQVADLMNEMHDAERVAIERRIER